MFHKVLKAKFLSIRSWRLFLLWSHLPSASLVSDSLLIFCHFRHHNIYINHYLLEDTVKWSMSLSEFLDDPINPQQLFPSPSFSQRFMFKISHSKLSFQPILHQICVVFVFFKQQEAPMVFVFYRIHTDLASVPQNIIELDPYSVRI